MQFCVICSGGGQLEHSAAPRCRERGDKSVRKLLNLSRLCSNQLRQAQYFSSISTLSSSSVSKVYKTLTLSFPNKNSQLDVITVKIAKQYTASLLLYLPLTDNNFVLVQKMMLFTFLLMVGGLWPWTDCWLILSRRKLRRTFFISIMFSIHSHWWTPAQALRSAAPLLAVALAVDVNFLNLNLKLNLQTQTSSDSNWH